MGKTRTAFIGDTIPEPSNARAKEGKEKRGHKRSFKEERGLASPKAMPAARVRVPGLKGGERVVAIESELPAEPTSAEAEASKGERRVKQPKKRSKKYLEKKTLVDPTKSYAPTEAVDLAKQTSLSRFPGKLELHLMLAKGGRFEVALPHATGVTKRIEVANQETIKKLESGNIDFDVLLTTPEFLPQLVPYARVLGPRGLMPNPKNGTITDNTKAALEKFSGNTVVLQTEKDAPLVHTVVGTLSDTTSNLTENLHTIFTTLGERTIEKAVISPTMGPGIKVAVS